MPINQNPINYFQVKTTIQLKHETAHNFKKLANARHLANNKLANFRVSIFDYLTHHTESISPFNPPTYDLCSISVKIKNVLT